MIKILTYNITLTMNIRLTAFKYNTFFINVLILKVNVWNSQKIISKIIINMNKSDITKIHAI